MIEWPRGTIYQIIEAGILAPSGDNLQPWGFRWNGGCQIDIYVDTGMDHSMFNCVYKGQKLATLISCGAVIENMRICAHFLGYGARAVYFPESSDEGCVARIILNKDFPQADENNDVLYPYIFRRCVNRRMYDSSVLDHQIGEQLADKARECEDIGFYWLKERAGLKEFADIARRSDRIMFENEGLLEPLIDGVRWTEAEERKKRDGLPAKSLELTRIETNSLRLMSFWPLTNVLNHLGLSRMSSLYAGRLVMGSSAVGLLTLTDLGPVKWICGGEVLERIWLEMTSLGLSLQPMAGCAFLILRQRLLDGQGLSQKHRSEIAGLQKKVYDLFDLRGNEIPLIAFRAGRAEAPSRRARRKRLEDFLRR